MSKPLVSILMPIYNSEKYMINAIESIINQNYNNWELIICDDCSTDNSYIIAQNYCKKDSRIKVIKNNKNMRQAYSRNQAYKISSGKYLAILDSDDRMTLDRLEKQVSFLENNIEYAFVCTNAIMFNNKNETVGYLSKKEYPSPFEVIMNKGFVYCSMMIRREVFKEVDGYTVSAITKTGEDYDLICKIYYLKYKGANLNEYLHEYRADATYTRRPFSVYLNQCKVCLKHIKKGWLKINGVSHFAVILMFSPLIKGIVPQKLIKQYHKLRFKNM